MIPDLHPPVDVAVIGAGIIGLATTREILAAGASAVCIERSYPGSGQSAGRVRIMRQYHDDYALITPCKEARALWGEWERAAGRLLVGDEGMLTATDEARTIAAQLESHDITATLVDLQREQSRYGILADEARPSEAVFEHDAGVIRAHETIDWLTAQVSQHIVMAYGFAVQPGEREAQVLTGTGVVRARHVLICAGASTETYAEPLGLRLPIVRGCHVRLMFRIERTSEARLPVWADRRAEFGPEVYALQSDDDAFLAVGQGGQHTDVPLGDSRVVEPEHVALLRNDAAALTEYVREAMPGLHPHPVEARLCMSTRLAASGDDFALMPHPSGTVSAFAGNNLFKWGPYVGRALARHALGAADVPDFMLLSPYTESGSH